MPPRFGAKSASARLAPKGATANPAAPANNVRRLTPAALAQAEGCPAGNMSVWVNRVIPYALGRGLSGQALLPLLELRKQILLLLLAQGYPPGRLLPLIDKTGENRL